MALTPEKLHALESSKGLLPTPKNLERLSAKHGGEAARWAFEQWSLRSRARSKFALAEQMLFDRDGLEMATHEHLAEWRADRFPAGAPVADLTCGIGGDLIALARRGSAIGYELDSARAELARWNLSVHGVEADVRVGDCGNAQGFDYAFADPSRRSAGRRARSLEEYEPDPRVLAQRFARTKLSAIKLSPMLDDETLESLAPRLEFVSFGRECREALAWFGARAVPGRYAVQVESGAILEAGDPPPVTDQPEEFLYDADPAAIRAHALGTLATGHDLRELGDTNGYLTGGEVASPWLRKYRVLASDAADPKRGRTILRELGAHVREVKHRGTGTDQQTWIKKLCTGGERPLTLVVWAVGKSLRLTFAEPA